MWSEKDSINLQRVADALEELLKTNVNIKPPLRTAISSKNFGLEEDFFRRISHVYANEQLIKIEKNLKRKSARRVSKNLTNELVKFFQGHLPELTVESDNAYILFKKENHYIALLRFHTDLGFHRGNYWFTEIEDTVKDSEKYDLQSHQVFFLVASMVNGLDNAHIQSILGNDAPDASLLLTSSYRESLENYLDKYVKSLPSLKNPLKQVFFLTSKEHPNGNQLVLSKNPLPSNIWIKPSVSEFVETIKKL